MAFESDPAGQFSILRKSTRKEARESDATNRVAGNRAHGIPVRVRGYATPGSPKLNLARVNISLLFLYSNLPSAAAKLYDVIPGRVGYAE